MSSNSTSWMRWHRLILCLLVSSGLNAEDSYQFAEKFQEMAQQVRGQLSHRDVLRSHQTEIRLLGCGNEDSERHICIPVYARALEDALEGWTSARRPKEPGEVVTILAWGEPHMVNLTVESDLATITQGVCAAAGDSSRIDACLGGVLGQLEEESEKIRQAKEAIAPPRHIPEELWEDFTDGGAIPVLDFYRDDSYAGYYKQFPRPFLSAMEEMVARRQGGTNYQLVDQRLYELLDAPGSTVAELLQGAVVGIIGSAVPWYEVLVLHYGAASAITIEYNQVRYDDPRILAMTPAEYWALGDDRPRFDVALSISSFEHDGLGRYGDPLNPFGDFEAMSEMESMLKPGGVMLLAVPVASEAIVWNAHRIYGRKRLTQLLSRWTLHSAHGLYEGIFEKRVLLADQPLFVLSNTRPEEPTNFLE
jgi:hypothetical protein